MEVNQKNKYIEILKKYRRDLHKIPELGFDLPKTNQYIINELERLGYRELTILPSGIIVWIPGKEKEAICFRADMDGLQIPELTNLSFGSTHPGKMHACGHDGHTAILLALAKYLKEEKLTLEKSIVLIFQAAEEGPGGAKPIIESGVFSLYNIQAIYGLHLDPSLAEGLYGLKSGPLMAMNGEFDLEIQGEAAHGGLPHLGKDPLIALSNLIQTYQTIISRNLNPNNPSVITIGTVEAGNARNIIASSAKLSGTIRTFSLEDYEYIKRRIVEINRGIEISFNLHLETKIRDYYSVVENDEDLYKQTILNLNKADYEIIPSKMLADDFSFYQRVTKGLYTMLGVRNEELGYTHPLHSPYFNFREEVLIRGLEFFLIQIKINENPRI